MSEPARGWPVRVVEARTWVIPDNDCSGDPDGLVQLAPHVLCGSVELRLVIDGQVPAYDAAWSLAGAEEPAAEAWHIAELAGRWMRRPSGVERSPGRPRPASADGGRRDLVAGAMRDDTAVPLVVGWGGSPTNIASAWSTEPRIAGHLTLGWVGGREHDDPVPPGSAGFAVECDSLDVVAAQVALDESGPDPWQVPADGGGLP